MAVGVRRLRPALRQGDELVAQVDEGHALAAPPQLECEYGAVEAECFVDVADLQRDVVDAD